MAAAEPTAPGTPQAVGQPLERCLSTGLVLSSGPALARAQPLEFGDLSSSYTPAPLEITRAGDPELSSDASTANSPSTAPADDPGLRRASGSPNPLAWTPTPLLELPGVEGGTLLLALPGGIQWAAGDYAPPSGDPLRSALELCRLLDRARRWPAECLPVEQRLARPASPERGSAQAALARALQSAARQRGEGVPMAQPPNSSAQPPNSSAQPPNSSAPLPKAGPHLTAGQSWSHWPALLAALSALGALLLWNRAPRP
jgi:hypothetical protein